MRVGSESSPNRPMRALPMRVRLSVLAVLAAAVALLPLRDARFDADVGRVSGAYRALSFWGASRAYPGDDIPSDAITSAHAYARDELRRPIAEAFGLREKTTTSMVSPFWDAIGPVNGAGRTLTLAFDPNDTNILYAGSAAGGLWRSATAGVGPTAWQRIDTGFPVLGVSTIAFEPGNSDVIYIGTGEVYNYDAAGDRAADRRTRGSYGIGILKSTDGGSTWSKSLDWSYNQQHGVWMVRVDPSNHDVVWAATTEGIYKSVDAGATWDLKLNVVMGTDVIVHPIDTDTIVAACGDLSSASRGIYRSTDGGATWTQITGGGLPASFEGKMQFGVTPANEDVVYLSIGNGFDLGPGNFTWLFRSADFGASWTLQSTTDYSRWQGWYSHDVAVHPNDASTIMCIGIDIWKSTNAGVTLIQESSGSGRFTGNLPPGGPEGTANYSHSDHHDVIYHPTDPDTIYVATDGGVFRSLDGGVTWAGANGGMQTQQFYNGTVNDPTDPDLAMGGLQDNGTVKYLGNGEWFQGVFGGDGGWAAINHDNPNIIFATWQWLSAVRSSNGGASWSSVTPPNPGGPVAFIAPFLMSPVDPTVLYAGSSYFFVTFDSGNTWFLGNGGAPLDGNPILNLALPQDNDDVVYVATYPVVSRGHVYVTHNSGSTFSDITGTLPDRYPGDLYVDPTDEATVYIVMSGFGSSHVFKSTNYGANWTDIDNGVLPDVPHSAVVVDPLFPDHVYVGNDIGIFVTINGGATWVQLALGLPEAMLVSDLGISPSNRKLRAYTHGNGVYEHELLDALVAVEEPVAARRGLSLSQNVPNPFRSATDIRFDLARAADVELSIYDVRGARLRTLASGSHAAGPHSVRWDARDRTGHRVAPGTYFARLHSGGASVTRRLVVLE